MKSASIALATLLVSSAALAQQPQQPKFVPFMVDEQNYSAITNALLELKLREGLPILTWINQMELKAQQQEAAKQAEAAKHPVEVAPK